MLTDNVIQRDSLESTGETIAMLRPLAARLLRSIICRLPDKIEIDVPFP